MSKIHIALSFHISSDKRTLSEGREALLALIPIFKKLSVPLTWVFEDHYYLNILDMLSERKFDEVHISSFNNSLYAFQNKEEFDFTFDKTVSQLKAKYDNVAPVFYPPEGAFTPSMTPLLKKKGIEYITLPYTPKGGIAGFLPKFKLYQQFNPLRYTFNNTTLSVMPAMRFGDMGIGKISDFVKLVKNIRREQMRSSKPQDMLLILDIDFRSPHAESCFKMFASKHTSAEIGEIENSKSDYVVWDTPYNYLKTHKAVGTLDFSEDIAYNRFSGFLKWQGNEVTRLYTMLERERLLSEHILKISSMTGKNVNKGLSAGLERRASLINSNFNEFQSELEKNQWNMEILLEKALSDLEQEEEVLTLFPETHYAGREKRGFIRLKLAAKEGENFALFQDNEELPCEIIEGENRLELRAYIETEKPKLALSLGKSSKEADEEAVLDNVLSIGDLVLVGDEKGNVSGFYRDKQFLDGESFNPKITYKKRTYVGEAVKLDTFKKPGSGRMVRSGELWYKGHRAEFRQSFYLSEKLPYIYAEVSIAYPDLAADDRNLTEVVPFEIIPSLRGEEGDPITVYKQSFIGDSSRFEIDYPYFSENREIDVLSNAITAGWLAVSNSNMGLLIAESVSHDFSPAFISMRLEKKGDFDSVRLNPFGVYFGNPIRNPLEQKFNKKPDKSEAFARDFAGESLNFYLMLAPYEGGAPGEQLVADALMHAYPPFIHIEKIK